MPLANRTEQDDSSVQYSHTAAGFGRRWWAGFGASNDRCHGQHRANGLVTDRLSRLVLAVSSIQSEDRVCQFQELQEFLHTRDLVGNYIDHPLAQADLKLLGHALRKCRASLPDAVSNE